MMCRSLLQQETLSLEGTQAAAGLQQPYSSQSACKALFNAQHGNEMIPSTDQAQIRNCP